MGMMLTTTDAVFVPEENVQVSVYVLCSMILVATCEPDVPVAEKLSGPETAHEVAPLELQVMLDDSPFLMSRGEASIERFVEGEPPAPTSWSPPPSKELALLLHEA